VKHRGTIVPALFIIGAVLIAVILVAASGIKTKSTEYISDGLKVSLSYPKPWFLNEKDRSIMITSYSTTFGENKSPDDQQVEISIDQFSNCFPNFERDLIEPACGQGGPGYKNQIVSKEVKETGGGTFYKYLVRTPKGQELIYRLLVHKDRILLISKQPDPSKFEKEFEEIVESIRFLD